jgi:hypothetical protein
MNQNITIPQAFYIFDFTAKGFYYLGCLKWIVMEFVFSFRLDEEKLRPIC